MSNLVTAPFQELYVQEVQDLMTQRMDFVNLFDNTSAWLQGRSINIPQYTNEVGIMRDYVEKGGGDYGFDDQGDTRVDFGNLKFDLRSTQGKPQKTPTTIEQMMLNFDAASAVLRNHAKKVVEFKGKELLYDAAKNVTSGRTVTATGALKPDGTSAVTYNDFVSLAELAADDNVEDELYAIVPQKMYSDILRSEDLTAANEIGVGQPRVDGVIARIAGINIINRSTVLQLSASTAGGFSVNPCLDPFISEAAQDQQAALVFTRNAIAFAMGETLVHTTVGNAQNYGADEFSSEILGSAHQARNDGKGIYLLANK